MNTGLQDAYNLSWKLAFAIKGYADERILETHHEERLPIARKLVRTTDKLFGITISQNPFVVFWRVHVMPRVKAPAFHLLLFSKNNSEED
jgi:2-polyprenyl-6-methoxyphenol hydroxylase-like FAD-dependent oxidoreductase